MRTIDTLPIEVLKIIQRYATPSSWWKLMNTSKELFEDLKYSTIEVRIDFDYLPSNEIPSFVREKLANPAEQVRLYLDTSDAYDEYWRPDGYDDTGEGDEGWGDYGEADKLMEEWTDQRNEGRTFSVSDVDWFLSCTPAKSLHWMHCETMVEQFNRPCRITNLYQKLNQFEELHVVTDSLLHKGLQTLDSLELSRVGREQGSRLKKVVINQTGMYFGYLPRTVEDICYRANCFNFTGPIDVTFSDFFTRHPNLRHLNVYNCRFSSISDAKSSSLQTLILRSCWMEGTTESCSLAEKFPSLRFVILRECSPALMNLRNMFPQALVCTIDASEAERFEGGHSPIPATKYKQFQKEKRSSVREVGCEKSDEEVRKLLELAWSDLSLEWSFGFLIRQFTR